MEEQDLNITLETKEEPKENKPGLVVMIFPLLLTALLLFGFTQIKFNDTRNSDNERYYSSLNDSKTPKINFTALLAQDQFSSKLRDTVYTDKDKYLELRIDEQMLYVHYRDGHIKKYPVSSGNKFLSKGIESRPGLFAIFLKEEIHLSSQFNDAKMFWYMPFNMGIGFHGLAGTGYYGNLGIRPSSHGCIRMRTEDAKALFKETEIGTLVLAHRGNTSRVIGFAPEGFKNERAYTKDDYMSLLAYNLNSLYEGKYFIHPPKRFIIDPLIIPRIGYYVGSTDDIPERQQIPLAVNIIEMKNDNLNVKQPDYIQSDPLDSSIANELGLNNSNTVASSDIDVTPELVKKLAYNPIGILPYFPPNK